MTKNIGYHFTGETLRDGRPIPAIGKTLVHKGSIVWCKSGLYWSREAFDALYFAPGPYLHMVEASEPEQEGGEKCVSRERTIIKSIDATSLLRRFAADQALSVAHLWDMPDVVREYLTDLDEAKRLPALVVAQTAVQAPAAWSAWAALSTARAAAWSAAQDAALAVREAADAGGAARAASRGLRQDFNQRVYDAFEEE